MEANSVQADHGTAWLKQGWQLFTRNPGLWIVMVIVYTALSVVLQLIPLLGSLVAALIYPAITGGMLYAAQQQDNDRDMEIMHIFQAFQDKSRTTPMLILGGLSVALSVLIMIVFLGMGGAAILHGYESGDAAAAGMTSLLAILLAAVVVGIYIMAFFFAVPLVMLQAVAPVTAIGDSFRACLKNIPPLLVYGIVIALAGIIASLPMMLGWLVLLPVLFTSQYYSYKDIFMRGAGGETGREM
jgi:uncharacterized membrane protein